MIVLAIDPGSTHSGYVLYDADDREVHDKGKCENGDLLSSIYDDRAFLGATNFAIEMAESFGAKVWSQVFDAVVWTGRFVEAWTAGRGLPVQLVYRRDVKLHLTGSPRAKDGQIRQCLLDRFGGKERALGTKLYPGPLRGVSADAWAALAIAVTFADGAVRKAA
jgi:Holliday junction resolvasome RuvABC endonuclease subunit